MMKSLPKYEQLSDQESSISDHDEGNVAIDLHVNKLSYSITDKPGSWWQKITNVQMPWEWMEPGKTTHILREVSFTAKSGQLVAIMGGSGSGKTSLLDVLSYRVDDGEIGGNVYLNSVSSTKSIVEACSGYVRQDDRLISFLTVRESLMFVAKLKLPKTFTPQQIEQRVDSVIAELGLKHVADSTVGNAEKRGLSGGERRRVSIGIQLLIMPSIVLLDEPTSGLDSFTANNIVQTLSKLTSKKRTVIMSIHQPRFDIFNIVDVLIILSEGRTVYYGPAKEMTSYFTTLGFPCPELTNPCDFYIDLATVDSTSREREERTSQTVHCLHDAYNLTDRAQAEAMLSTEGVISPEEIKSYSEVSPHNKKRGLKGLFVPQDKTLQQLLRAHEDHSQTPGIGAQIYNLFKRFNRITVDDWPSLLTHILEAIFMSFLLGLGFYQLKRSQSSIRDWFGAMFIVSALYPYMIILGLIGKCHEERRFYYFELQDKLYHPFSLYVAKVMSDLPFHLVLSLVYCIPVYGMADLRLESYNIGMFFFIVSSSVFTSRCLAMMCAYLLPTYQLSCVLAQTLFSLFIMSAGFLINIGNMLSETRWIADLFYLRWGFQALTIVQIEDLTFECDVVSSLPCVQNGSQAMEVYSFQDGDLWHCFLGIGLNMITFLILMLVGLIWVPQKPHDEG